MNYSGRFIFIGNYLDEQIVKNRSLNNHNPAASNRIIRLSESLIANNFYGYIIAPGSSARLKFNKKLLYPLEIKRKNRLIVIYTPALSIPYLSILFEIISIFYIFLNISIKKRISLLLVYCYYPSNLLPLIISKFQNIKSILDLEDVVEPKFSDWYKKHITFTLQQLLGKYFMLFSIRFCNKVIIPTIKFSKFVRNKNKIILINGCIEVSANNLVDTNRLNILFGGYLNKENGLYIFLDTLKLLNLDINKYKNFHFYICGKCEDETLLKNTIESFENLDIKYFSFINEIEYVKLLDEMDLCLVLQNPNGRNANNKTPSKGYEYMAHGKTIIVTPIGDFVNLPINHCIFLNNYDPPSLYEIFSKINEYDLKLLSKNSYNYAKSNWSYLATGKKILNNI